MNLANVTDAEAIISKVSNEITIEENKTVTIKPKDFILAYTQERIKIPKYLAARVEGRSSIARFGLSIHQTAPTVHATFNGQLRLEIMNNGPLPCVLSPGMVICQLILERLGSPALRSLNSNFQNQTQDT